MDSDHGSTIITSSSTPTVVTSRSTTVGTTVKGNILDPSTVKSLETAEVTEVTVIDDVTVTDLITEAGSTFSNKNHPDLRIITSTSTVQSTSITTTTEGSTIRGNIP